MKFRTRVEKCDFVFRLHHQMRVLSLGSCFSENIGKKLIQSKFPTLLNPFGIVYNPVSIHHILEQVFSKKLIQENELTSCQDYYCHPLFHSQFNSTNKTSATTHMNQSIAEAHKYIKDGIDLVIISLGTSFVWKQKSSQKIVNNCHKIEASAFDKQLLKVDQIQSSLAKSIELIDQQNPATKVLLTVSPIRHTKEGLIQNQRSKSQLIVAANEMAETYENVIYFPSYEMLVDDLRDYRFYENDMIHPSDQAIEYIWSYFKELLIDGSSLDMISALNKLQSMINHKPFLPDSKNYQEHLTRTNSKLEAFSNKYPELDLNPEKNQLHRLKTDKA